MSIGTRGALGAVAPPTFFSLFYSPPNVRPVRAHTARRVHMHWSCAVHVAGYHPDKRMWEIASSFINANRREFTFWGKCNDL